MIVRGFRGYDSFGKEIEGMFDFVYGSDVIVVEEDADWVAWRELAEKHKWLKSVRGVGVWVYCMNLEGFVNKLELEFMLEACASLG
jgi:hypothetical protein